MFLDSERVVSCSRVNFLSPESGCMTIFIGNQSAYERVLRIVHEGLKGARGNHSNVKRAGEVLGVGFVDVIAVAIAAEIVDQFNLKEVSETT
jgi:hypothetical protein